MHEIVQDLATEIEGFIQEYEVTSFKIGRTSINSLSTKIKDDDIKMALEIIEQFSLPFDDEAVNEALRKRFINYGNEFKYISFICSGDKPSDIVTIEEELIDYFINESNFSHLCKNINIGGGAKNSTIVYIVYNT